MSQNNCDPQHYSVMKRQPMEFIRENNWDFLRGNVLKYIARHENKNGLEDLKKAYVYFMQHVAFHYGLNGVEEVQNTKWDVTDSFINK